MFYYFEKTTRKGYPHNCSFTEKAISIKDIQSKLETGIYVFNSNGGMHKDKKGGFTAVVRVISRHGEITYKENYETATEAIKILMKG